MISITDGGLLSLIFNNQTVYFTVIKGQVYGNGWIDFGVSSDDPIFSKILGMQIFRISIRPKQKYDSQKDSGIRNDSQKELISKLTDAINDYFYKNA